MNNIVFPTIDMTATGENIIRLRKMSGLSVRDIQSFFGFEEPQAVYKWQQGKSLPTVDNLLALSVLFGVSMNEILVRADVQKETTISDNSKINGQSFDCPFSNIDISRFGSNGIVKHPTNFSSNTFGFMIPLRIQNPHSVLGINKL